MSSWWVSLPEIFLNASRHSTLLQSVNIDQTSVEASGPGPDSSTKSTNDALSSTGSESPTATISTPWQLDSVVGAMMTETPASFEKHESTNGHITSTASSIQIGSSKSVRHSSLLPGHPTRYVPRGPWVPTVSTTLSSLSTGPRNMTASSAPPIEIDQTSVVATSTVRVSSTKSRNNASPPADSESATDKISPLWQLDSVVETMITGTPPGYEKHESTNGHIASTSAAPSSAQLSSSRQSVRPSALPHGDHTLPLSEIPSTTPAVRPLSSTSASVSVTRGEAECTSIIWK